MVLSCTEPVQESPWTGAYQRLLTSFQYKYRRTFLTSACTLLVAFPLIHIDCDVSYECSPRARPDVSKVISNSLFCRSLPHHVLRVQTSHDESRKSIANLPALRLLCSSFHRPTHPLPLPTAGCQEKNESQNHRLHFLEPAVVVLGGWAVVVVGRCVVGPWMFGVFFECGFL